MLRVGLSKMHAHTEAGVCIDDFPGQLTRAAAIADADAQLRAGWKRINRVYIAAARAQLGDPRDDAHPVPGLGQFSLGNKREARMNPAFGELSFRHGVASSPTKAVGRA